MTIPKRMKLANMLTIVFIGIMRNKTIVKMRSNTRLMKQRPGSRSNFPTQNAGNLVYRNKDIEKNKMLYTIPIFIRKLFF